MMNNKENRNNMKSSDKTSMKYLEKNSVILTVCYSTCPNFHQHESFLGVHWMMLESYCVKAYSLQVSYVAKTNVLTMTVDKNMISAKETMISGLVRHKFSEPTQANCDITRHNNHRGHYSVQQ